MKLIQIKRLIVIRHAHRDTSHRELDNGLSDKGRAQVKKLVAHARDAISAKARPHFMSSPKLRCIETISPIAEELDCKLEVSDWLDEGDRLRERVREFAAWWKSPRAPAVTVICSHGDWIPECLAELTGKSIDLEKAGWAEISVSVRD